MAKITKIEIQKRNKERVNLFLDNEYAFSLSTELVYKEDLKVNEEVDSEKLRILAEREALIRCKDSALRIIERSYKTEKEVRDKLSLKGYDDNAISKSIEFLKEYNFINDIKYTKAFINDKLNSTGSHKIKYTLIQKGISKEIIEEELSNLSDQNEKKAALDLAKKKIVIIKKRETDNYKICAKVSRYLFSRGYGYDVINEVVKEAMSLDDLI
jgi:regulatory protein